MNINCWNCSMELDARSVYKAGYRQGYSYTLDILKERLADCQNVVNGECDIWYRHEDCHALMNIIKEIEENYEGI